MGEARRGKQVYQKGNGGGQVVFLFFLSFRSWDVLLRGVDLPPGEGFHRGSAGLWWTRSGTGWLEDEVCGLL